MHVPLLEPYRLECAGCDFRHQRGNIWITEGAETVHRQRADIRIRRIERRFLTRRGIEHDIDSVQAGLKENVFVDPVGEVAAVPYEGCIAGELVCIRSLKSV